MTIYDRIRELRIVNNMSQDDLAHAMGYKDRSMITKIESGKVDISQKKIISFAKVLGTTPGYLMGWTEESIPEQQEIISTSEARILARGIDRLPEEERKKALKVVQAMFSQYEEYFNEGDKHDTESR